MISERSDSNKRVYGVVRAALDGVIGEPLGSSLSAVDASAQGHEAGNLSAESAPEEGER